MENWWSGMVDGFNSKKGANALIGLGSGLLSQPTFAKGLAAGGQGFMQGAELDQQYADAEAEKLKLDTQGNTTRAWLEQQGFTDLVPLVDAGQAGLAYNEALKRMQPGYGDLSGGAPAPANVQEWQYYSGLSPEERTQYLNMKRANTPLNIGTGFVTQDQANPGALLGAPIAIQNEQKAYDTNLGGVLGTAEGENLVAAESVSSKLPGLRTVVSELSDLAQTATYTTAGQLIDNVMRETGQEPSEAAIARAKYIAAVDNQVLPLLRDTFGAAFTQKEGETLRATLGNANASPAEKQAILEAFIAQKERDVAGMQSRMDRQSPAGGDVDSILQKYGVP